MEKRVMDEFKNHFLAMRQKLMAEMGLDSLAPESFGDEIDRSLEDQNLQLVAKLKGRDVFYLKKINEALLRIEDGHFGQCLDCGSDIGFNRLRARPTAELCIKCKEDQEKVEGMIPYHRRSHTLGQSISSGTSSEQESPSDSWGRGIGQIMMASLGIL